MRMRPDLTVRKHRYHGEAYWVVKEPIGLNYFRFHEEEFAILQMLDGQSSLDSIKERFESDFAPQKITFQDLQQFIGMLHRSGLVISETAGQGRQLAKRRGEKKRREWLGRLTNVFALRWRGVDPERFLNWLYPYVRWMFHPVCVALCLAIGIGALLLVTVQFEVFRSRLPTFHEFFDPRAPDKWLYLALTMGVVKVLHELGHGLSCKHFGGECHEIGFMLLVLTPCLYCNVSDSWMLPNKWKRAMIGAAGMYVEIVLASIATFLWWFSDRSGLLNNLALNVMFICSVSTLIFNGNPLLRFDGYYILMDLAEIPNLRQKSTEVLKRFMVGVCLGLEQPDNPFLPQKNRFLFGAYTIAAVVYRWIIVFSIVAFLIKVFEPIGLKIIGQIVAATGFFGLIVQPLWQLARFFYLPGRMHKVKKHRVIASVAVVGAVLAAVVFLPLPHSVKCEFEVGPRDAAAVYVEVPGLVKEILVKEGHRVDQGQPLLVLSNPDLELSVLDLQGRRDVTESRLRVANREQFADDQSGLQIGQLRELLAATEQQLAEKQQELARLKLVAPTAGVIIPAAPRTSREEEAEGRLPTWSGSPLDRKNLGAAYQASELVCRVGDPTDLEALLVVDQADIDLVDAAMGVDSQGRPKVKLQLDAFPGRTLHSHVEQVARVELKAMSASLSSQAGGRVETKMDRSGVSRPLSTSYQARVPLDDQDALQGLISNGMRGRAQIYTRWQSLGARLYRYLSRTFHFEL
ncbi:MAG: biotin/lipoyl-binding protein [Candidatus Anammoximicrobium sp.]|nr:biotin/lipoyl-binding protein [Candidatus Anammoximicrobium sp.]